MKSILQEQISKGGSIAVNQNNQKIYKNVHREKGVKQKWCLEAIKATN